eukprot:TRINITY_DN7374_c0_g1_i15.p1 TRINITY_DN7374_c0_g1~~TRINITY_DN7374_c0_g1_i15.p1  ORF type:complete len:152 (-),score=20.41 TRINITY_DN7374_c0_g1_i15:136-591(-)
MLSYKSLHHPDGIIELSVSHQHPIEWWILLPISFSALGLVWLFERGQRWAGLLMLMILLFSLSLQATRVKMEMLVVHPEIGFQLISSNVLGWTSTKLLPLHDIKDIAIHDVIWFHSVYYQMFVLVNDEEKHVPIFQVIFQFHFALVSVQTT